MIKRFHQFESADINSTLFDNENEVVNNFDWSPYTVDILTCVGDIDEGEGHITIKLTNRDIIAYHYSIRGPRMNENFEINHKRIEDSELEIFNSEYVGSMQSLVADVLLFYKERFLAKKSV
jgi:hypothetical protein